MSSFLNSVKADLLDRRLLPLVAAVAVVLVAAIGYAVFGGGSSGSTQVASIAPGPVVPSTGVAISQSTSNSAVAETTGGVADQHHGHARNPFTPLAQPKSAQVAASATTAPSTASAPSTGTASTGSGESSAPAKPAPAKPAPAPAKPKTVYHVALLFGVIPAGATPQTVQLTPYENIKLMAPLPSSGHALAVYRGVTAGGKSATFTLVGEAILHGQGKCLPSASQCEALDLHPGQAEQLEYLAPGALTATTYELRVVSIASSKASAAAVKGMLAHQSKAGRALLRSQGLLSMPFLRYSTAPGVLVFAPHHAFGARAHAAHRRHHGR